MTKVAEFARSVDSLSQLVGTLAERKQELSGAIAYTNEAAGSISDLLAQARAPVAKSVHESDRAAAAVLAERDYLANLLDTLPDAYQMLNRQGLYGDYFSFYLCDLVLKLNGKGGQPVYVKVVGQSSGKVRTTVKYFSERNQVRCRRGRCRRHRGRDPRCRELPQAAVLQFGQGVFGVLRRGRRAGTGNPGTGRGFAAGKVNSIELDGARVLVTFEVDDDIPLGDRTEAVDQDQKLSRGAGFWKSHPRGDGEQSGPIPVDRTTPPYQLPDALGDLG